MATSNAGLYGPEAILSSTGAPAPSTPVTVFIHSTTTDAALFTDNTMTASASNPVTTDTFGNCAFYAAPGLYDLSFTVGGTATTKTVFVAPWNVDSSIPTGSIFDYAGTTLPAGWLLCDGTAYSRTTYSVLFTALGTTWGAGDGSTTFNVPDMRGRVTVGAGSVGTNAQPTLALGAVGGEQNHTLATGEMPGHAHSASDSGHTHTGPGGVEYAVGLVGSAGYSVNSPGTGNYVSFSSVSGGGNANVTIGSTGGGGGHNTMQPYATVQKMVKA